MSRATTSTTRLWDDARLADPHAVEDKSRRVRAMFAAIAPHYDRNNRVHSFGIDRRWRRRAVALSGLREHDVIVDVACGTGDLTLAYAAGDGTVRPGRVIGVDYTFEMLPLAEAKSAVSQVSAVSRVSYVAGDATALPLPDGCCDVVSIAFGIRNVADPSEALAEFRRVLRPGGRVIVLEFSLPTNALVRLGHTAYCRHVMPRTAAWLAGDRTGAYRYLAESVRTFMSREEMSRRLSGAGFGDLSQHPLTLGTAVVYRGVVA